MENPLQPIAEAARIVGDADALARTMRFIQKETPKLRKSAKLLLNTEAAKAPSFKTHALFTIELRIGGQYLPLRIGDKVLYETEADRDTVFNILKP